MRRLAATTLLFLAASAAIAAPNLPEVERLVNRGTNQFRTEQRLAPLEVDARLARAAQEFADYMARTDRYGHDADGREPAERAKAQGYDHCQVAENLSYQSTTADFATEELAHRYVEGWKASPGHRRNLVEPHTVHTAAAVARSARTGRYYGVQMFGRPRDRSIEFRVTNVARMAVRYRVGAEDFSLLASQQRVHTVCMPQVVTFPDAANAEGRIFRPSGGERLQVEGEKRPVVRNAQ